MSIKPLPPDVIAQIKSSTTITSLNGVIFELMKNSLDAGSTKIDIGVDYARGGCVVEDDGLGILPSEFGEKGGLGKLYHSSKLACKTPVHGGRGTFIASLSCMSLLSVTSHHHEHRSHNAMSMHKSQVISRQNPASAQQYLSYLDHGTKVTVQDLFGSMPVRVKQRAMMAEKQGWSSKDREALKRDMVILLLAWPVGVFVTLRVAGTNHKMVLRTPTTCISRTLDLNISKVCSILTKASFITPQEQSSWVSIRASTTRLEVHGAISLMPIATKHLQFIAFGIQPLMPFDGHSILHDEINRLFQNSAFGSEESDEPAISVEGGGSIDGLYGQAGFTDKELKGARKGVDRWPMFYINIHQQNLTKTDVEDFLDDNDSGLRDIVELLQAMFLEFLSKNHFRPNRSKGLRVANTKVNDEALADIAPGRNSGPELANRTTNESRPSKGQMSDSDLLGESVKITSFPQHSASNSPFDAWSRVKRGTSLSRSNNSKKPVVSPLTQSPLDRPATALLPPKTCSPTSIVRSSTSCSSGKAHTVKSSLPLISSTGKIIRRPFDEVDFARPKANPAMSQPHRVPSVDHQNDKDDDLVMWVNPVTKMQSLVNQRTGLTLPVTNTGSTELSAATRNQRLSSHQSLRSKETNKQPSDWIGSLFKNWDNPIFRPTEAAIPQVSVGQKGDSYTVLHGRRHNCTQLDIDKAFKEISAGIHGRISKDALRKAEVISQVDKKFILVKICSPATTGGTCREEGMLVIIDQHAADERIRIEALLSELCSPPPATTESSIKTTLLPKPLTFDTPSQEIDLLLTYKQHFSNWGILFSLSSTTTGTSLIITSLPPAISERCTSNPRLLIDLIRTELHNPNVSTCSITPSAISRAEETNNWLRKIHTIPQGLLDMLNSRACRSAIMFNDELSKQQCKNLVRRLAGCSFPFQCAHGRPSLVPVVELGGLGGSSGGVESGEKGLGRSFKKWKEQMDGI